MRYTSTASTFVFLYGVMDVVSNRNQEIYRRLIMWFSSIIEERLTETYSLQKQALYTKELSANV